MCFAVFLGSWSPRQFNLGSITQYGGGLLSERDTMTLDHLGQDTMGPKPQDSYSTPNSKYIMVLGGVRWRNFMGLQFDHTLFLLATFLTHFSLLYLFVLLLDKFVWDGIENL